MASLVAFMGGVGAVNKSFARSSAQRFLYLQAGRRLHQVRFSIKISRTCRSSQTRWSWWSRPNGICRQRVPYDLPGAAVTDNTLVFDRDAAQIAHLVSPAFVYVVNRRVLCLIATVIAS
jgi:hypothetical protein